MSNRNEIITLRESALRLMVEDKQVDGMVAAMRADFLEQKDRADEYAALVARAAFGGAIVASSQLSVVEIAEARASGRLLVREDGIGFAYVPESELAALREKVAELESSERGGDVLLEACKAKWKAENDALRERNAAVEAALLAEGRCKACVNGKIDDCPYCADSTHDHECPPPRTCRGCDGTTVPPRIRDALSGGTAALDAHDAALLDEVRKRLDVEWLLATDDATVAEGTFMDGARSMFDGAVRAIGKK